MGRKSGFPLLASLLVWEHPGQAIFHFVLLGRFPFCVWLLLFFDTTPLVLKEKLQGITGREKIKYFDLNIQFHLAIRIELSTVWRCVHEIFKEKRHLLQETLAGWLENQEPELLSISSLQGCFQN